MPNLLHIVHVQHPSPRLVRSRWLLGVIIGIAGGMLAGWLLVS